MKIKYMVGDALEPCLDNNCIIAHSCNDAGGFGTGFAGAINRKWITPKNKYKQAFNKGEIELGQIQVAKVASDIYVANMIAQHGYAKGTNVFDTEYIQYDKLEECLYKVAVLANEMEASVHLPRIGSVRGGGDWAKIESIIAKTLCYHDVPTYVYTLPSETHLF